MTTYTPEQIQQVRLLIPDVSAPQVFSDADISSYLDLGNGSARLAAADALDAIAVDETLVYRYVKTDDLTVDGTKGADILRKRAKDLRDQETATTLDYFDLAFPVHGGARIPEATARPWCL